MSDTGRHIEADDSDEPITAEWWHTISGGSAAIPTSHAEIILTALAGGVYLETRNATMRLDVKTRGDVRDLCRLLGVPLK